MADWKTLSVQIPGQDLLEGARGAMETVGVYLEVVKTILETVKIFLVDFGNPVKPIVEAVLQLIFSLFETLRRTGLYAWYDVPDPTEDPNFNRFLGGFQAFVTRFSAGLRDPRDPNRPQPISGATQGGFILIVADAEKSEALMKYLTVLMRFFGKEFTMPRYPAPHNARVLPIKVDPTGRMGGDPILAVSALFQKQPSSIAVEWSLPPVTPPGDPGFADLIQGSSQLVLPPKFLIERSEKNPVLGELGEGELGVADATGPVVALLDTEFRERGKGNLVKRKVKLADVHGDPFIKFQKYIEIDALSNSATFFTGQLGNFRYIDSDVEPNKVYYYRVRAYSGALDLFDGKMVTAKISYNVNDKSPYVQWPSADPSADLVMGKSSGVMQILLPSYPDPIQFDVVENLRRLFQVAFSLNFHLEMPQGSRFSPDGLAIDPTPNSDIGKGILKELAGPLTFFQALPLVGDFVSGITDVSDSYAAVFQPSPATGLLPAAPWNESAVRRNAARLANIVATAMLQSNSALGFKSLMEGPLTKGTPDVEGLDTSSLSAMVFQITKVQDPQKAGQGAVQDAGVLYSSLFADPYVRLNVRSAIEYCRSFTLVGTPPNWIQISVLRDIAPWSGKLVYEILAKMQALLDAYAGVTTELNAFVDLLVQKVDTLEAFLEYLTSILNFVVSLSLGFYVLKVPVVEGDINAWESAIANAGGTPPPSGPGGYTGGVAIAYVAPDVSSYRAALDLIF